MNMKKNSKCLMAALVLSLLFVLFFAQSALAQEIRLSASTETGNVGDTVTVKVSITNALDTEGGQFDLSYGPTLAGGTLMLEPVSISGGDFVPSFSSDNYNLNIGDNKLRVLWITAAGSSKDSGVICNIVFRITGVGETQLNFSDVLIVDPRVGRLLATPTSGKVTGSSVTEPETAKALAIKAANDAISALPAVENLKLDDKSKVVDARYKVEFAKREHNAVNDDFPALATLIAAENRIKELEGIKPTPPTGGAYFLLLGGSLILIAGVVAILKRRQLLTGQ